MAVRATDDDAPRDRDLQATYQGLVFALWGVAWVTMVIVRDPPDDRRTQLIVFAGWMLALAGIAGGGWLARRGVLRNVYGHRAGLCSLMTMVATAMLIFATYLILIALGYAPLPTVEVDAKPVEIAANELDPPAGWRKDGPTTFSRGRGANEMTAEVMAMDIAGIDGGVDLDDWEDGVTGGLAEDEDFDDVEVTFAGRQQPIQPLPIEEMPVHRVSASGRFARESLAWDIYGVHDAQAELMWTVTFARRPPRARGDATAERRFLEDFGYPLLER